jgi:hypothetical protein
VRGLGTCTKGLPWSWVRAWACAMVRQGREGAGHVYQGAALDMGSRVGVCNGETGP